MTIPSAIRALAMLVATVLIARYVALAGIEPYFERTTCANGYKNAYVVTEIDTYSGCVIRQYGVDCDSASFYIEFHVQPLSADPGGIFHLTHTGQIGGHTWLSRSRLTPNGFVEKTWGRGLDGGYYEAVVDSVRYGE